MNRTALIDQIKAKKSFLCVGLDVDPLKLPTHLLGKEDGIFEFNKGIIDATQDLCVSYKLNIAFYESLGIPGWKAMEKTIDYIPKNQFLIADAKRGDIGNTSERYAKTFFDTYHYHSITVAPYMGRDSVMPFRSAGKWVIILGLTSNPGSQDFQMQKLENGQYVFEQVIETASQWGSEEDTMFVVGATHPEQLAGIRKMLPHHFLLIPGVGKQGGRVSDVAEAAFVKNECGLLVNSSRGIIYASSELDFADAARAEALKLQEEMAVYL
ncbi:orotidine-5'-phosphate decarboxylase [Membranihabitans marinus]|uniref:orotidine-5'-phosphate decarboxylase n=1 Tax=Membranihabitans marinus TaxID=1227546 RepID=UPI001F024B5C|nr:orotidine-5'-phosphate decarboxylase [Membranihabitans marinus]